MPNVHMICVSHIDLRGEERLYRLLHHIAPESVLLEEAEFHYRLQELYMQILTEELSRRVVDPRLAQILIKEQAVKGYETRAARRYCKDRSLPEPGYLLDHSVLKSEQLPTHSMLQQTIINSIESALKEHTYESAGLHLTFAETAGAGMYHELCRFVGAPDEETVWRLLDRTNLENDERMECALREAVRRGPEKRISTVTGLKHILSDPKKETFYSRIADFRPQRYTLGGEQEG